MQAMNKMCSRTDSTHMIMTMIDAFFSAFTILSSLLTIAFLFLDITVSSLYSVSVVSCVRLKALCVVMPSTFSTVSIIFVGLTWLLPTTITNFLFNYCLRKQREIMLRTISTIMRKRSLNAQIVKRTICTATVLASL